MKTQWWLAELDMHGNPKLTDGALYMPNNDFYCATVREAVRYWNNYAKALNAIRRRNSWVKHSAIRKKEQP